MVHSTESLRDVIELRFQHLGVLVTGGLARIRRSNFSPTTIEHYEVGQYDKLEVCGLDSQCGHSDFSST
jgi:hypothetical protein